MNAAVQTKENILNLIEEHKNRIESFGVRRIRLFGSFARRESSLESDIDLFVEFKPGEKSFRNLMELGDFLEDLLGRHVELVTPGSLDRYIGPYILHEVEHGGQASMPKSSLPYLQHILDEANLLIERSTSLKKNDFMQDEFLKRGVVRSLEIIGEAAKKVPSEFREKHKKVNGKGMAGMRDRLIHEYDTVDYDTVWDVVKKEIPTLKQRIEEIIQEEREENKRKESQSSSSCLENISQIPRYLRY